MSAPIDERIAALDWAAIVRDLEAHGVACAPAVLTAGECAALAGLFADEAPFRRRIDMGRHGYGSGEYRYFAYPLPDIVAALRAALYSRLAPLANRWSEALGTGVDYPDRLDGFLARCHAAGQARPTPLLLSYGPGDYNRLHQDLYGEHVFPLQATFLLSRPGPDFEGGEFVMTEQRPRMQSRAEVVPLGRGDGVIFASLWRPVAGARGVHRATLRHGVSRLRRGRRRTLGIIFHDAA